nr:Uncharacterised protein [Klebsiella pneumoniae]
MTTVSFPSPQSLIWIRSVRPLVDIEESAGGGFSLRLIAHVSLPVNQISVVALSEPNPAIHSGIGR